MAGSPITGAHPICAELIRLFKLPKHTRAFSIRARYDDVVEIDCTYLPEAPDGGVASLEEIAKTFRLVETADG